MLKLALTGPGGLSYLAALIMRGQQRRNLFQPRYRLETQSTSTTICGMAAMAADDWVALS